MYKHWWFIRHHHTFSNPSSSSPSPLLPHLHFLLPHHHHHCPNLPNPTSPTQLPHTITTTTTPNPSKKRPTTRKPSNPTTPGYSSFQFLTPSSKERATTLSMNALVLGITGA